MMNLKTFEDACTILGINPEHLFYKAPPGFGLEEYEEHLNAYTKLLIIIRALNEGWKPDWDHEKEKKYYAWFWMSKARGFGLHDVDDLIDNSCVASRLCLKEEYLAKYVATQFKDICEIYYKG